MVKVFKGAVKNELTDIRNCLIEFTLIRATTAQLECDISC